MNVEIRDQWVAALTSGKFKQGGGQLAMGDGMERYYCCLGVLCELAADAGVTVRRGPWEYGKEKPHGATLPEEVIEWAGLDGESPEVPVTAAREMKVPDNVLRPYTTRISLAELNDSDVPFTQIAELIKTEL